LCLRRPLAAVALAEAQASAQTLCNTRAVTKVHKGKRLKLYILVKLVDIAPLRHKTRILKNKKAAQRTAFKIF
jgi:hypothetical protein